MIPLEKKVANLSSKVEKLEAQNKQLCEENMQLLKWKCAFEKAPFAMAVYDFLRDDYYPNQVFLQLLDRQTPVSDSFSLREFYKDSQTAAEILDSMISGEFWTGEVEIQKSKEDTFFAHLNASPVNVLNDEMISLISLHQNFPQNELLKEQKELHSQYFQTLQAITLGMIRRLGLSDLLNAILMKACTLTQISNGFMFLYNASEDKLILKAACGRYKAYMGHEVTSEEGFIGEVFDSKEPIIVMSRENFKDRSNSEIFKGVQCIIGVPLISGARLLGVIGMSDDEDKIDTKLIAIIEEFSSIATIAIDNSQLYSDLKMEFQKRLEIETESKEREQRSKEIVKKQNEELKQAYIDSLHRLVLASEFKDEDTGDHIVRIGEYSRILAQKLGWSEKEIEIIKYAAPMHDVGKIGIADKIMLKPGKLSHEEFEIIKTHTIIGAKLLSESKSDILKMAKQIALCHHEKYNGTGYPKGLLKNQIPLAARIVAIVDTFDALTSKRPYKDPYPTEMVLGIIIKERGKHFDPHITDLFVEHFEEFLKVRETIGGFEEVVLENFSLSERDKALLEKNKGPL